MVEQDVKAEAKKIENLANRSLNGDHQTATDAANRLRSESQDIMNASPVYRAALQKQLDADQKAELERIKKSDTADKWLPDVAIDKDKLEISKVDGHGGYKNIETFHKDGSVGYQETHFADEKPVPGVGDATVAKNQDGKVDSITRPDQSVTKIERDANGDPTKITGIENQIWTKKAGSNEWSVTDLKGNPDLMNPTRSDVEVGANGDVKSKGFFGETRTVHPDGSNDTSFTHGPETITFRSADGSRVVTKGNDYTEYNSDGTVRKSGHVVPQASGVKTADAHKNGAAPSGDPLVTHKNKGGCAPGDPLCSDI